VSAPFLLETQQRDVTDSAVASATAAAPQLEHGHGLQPSYVVTEPQLSEQHDDPARFPKAFSTNHVR
jgi:hypothetical protein